MLPLRWGEDDGLAGLTDYLGGLPAWVEPIVVDGSPDELFEAHARAWEGIARHLRPDPALHAPMGKVAGVLTGLREASHERVVIADDDVRYDERSLARAVTLLDLADCVRPQNYFDPLPWHARWDTARTLLNRSLGADFPGTLAVRRSTVLHAGGYDGDVIFENLELIRTILAVGGRVVTPLDLYVARHPPTGGHFLSQRIRQAYDDLAIPPRMAVWLAVIPALGPALVRGNRRGPALMAAAVVALAEIGRRRAGGRAYFPTSASALAPLWVLERGVCSWLALRSLLVRRGIPYGGVVVPRSASSMRRLRRRFAVRDRERHADCLARGSPEPNHLVRPVAERFPAGSSAAT